MGFSPRPGGTRPGCGHVWLFLVKVFYPSGVMAVDVDDTLFHRSGRNVNGAGWWRDAVRSTGTKVVHAWGLNLVVLTVRVTAPWGGEPIGLPINLRRHRKNGSSLTDLAEAMLGDLNRWFPERRFRACADGFYASLAGKRIPRIHLVRRMRRDAAIYDLPRPKPKGKKGPHPRKGPRRPTPQAWAKRVRSWKTVKTIERGKGRQRLIHIRPVIWYHVSHDPVLLVISRDPSGKERDDFFFNTDVDAKPADVIEIFAGRRSIEDTFKNTKQRHRPYQKCESSLKRSTFDDHVFSRETNRGDPCGDPCADSL